MRISGVLIDIDGVLTVSWQPLPGAVAVLCRLRAAGLPVALVTNTTSRPRSAIAAVLAGAGFPVTAADILTAPAIAAAYLNDHYPGARCLLLNSGDIGEDLAGVTLAPVGDPAPVEVVLVGGAGPEFSYQALNRAFGCLRAGPGWWRCTGACTGAPARACSSTAGPSSPGSSRPPASRLRWWASPPRRSSPPR
jgi:HAD superfamily hydrolase (TIGR01450 family)